MTIKTVEYTLPEYVACYAMYGESSGDDDLESAYDEWIQREMSFHGWTGLHLIYVKKNGFMAYHELHDFGVGSCDTSNFTFHVIG